MTTRFGTAFVGLFFLYQAKVDVGGIFYNFELEIDVAVIALYIGKILKVLHGCIAKVDKRPMWEFDGFI